MRDNYWRSYLAEITNGDNIATIATKCNVSPSTASRWLNGKNIPSPTEVINLARAYGQSPTQALWVAGYLSPTEAGIITEAFQDITKFSDEALLEELRRRIKEKGGTSN